MAVDWLDCFGAFAVIWLFLIAVLLTNWLVDIYMRFRG